jgi:hypothetical protein
VAFFLNAFQGRIRIQATLTSTPVVDEEWFQVYDFDSTSEITTENFSQNITGNFTWIRARVEDFETGTITKVMLSY